MNDAAPPRRIWLCADDYGISPGVNRAIRDLIERGRLNATSVMVVGPATGRDEIAALQDAVANSPRCAIGLHVTLTAPFRPLTMHFRPLDGGMFPRFPKLLRAGLLRRLDLEIIQAELMVQLAAFREMFGRTPDFVDGHQHVQLYPAGARRLSGGSEGGCAERLGSPGRPQSAADGAARRAEGAVSRYLERAIPRAAPRRPISPSIPALPAPMIFPESPISAALMRHFLDGLPAGGVIMCHPGFVDDILIEPRSAYRSARVNTLFSAASISRASWTRIKLHWADIAQESPRGVVALQKFNSPTGTSWRHKAPLHLRAFRASANEQQWTPETAMTPQERQLVDDLFDRLSKLESAPRDPDASQPSRRVCGRRPTPSTRWCRPCCCRTKRCKRANSRIQELEQAACAGASTSPAGSSIRCATTIFGQSQSRGSVPNVPPPAEPSGLEQRPGAAAVAVSGQQGLMDKDQAALRSALWRALGTPRGRRRRLVPGHGGSDRGRNGRRIAAAQ